MPDAGLTGTKCDYNAYVVVTIPHWAGVMTSLFTCICYCPHHPSEQHSQPSLRVFRSAANSPWCACTIASLFTRPCTTGTHDVMVLSIDPPSLAPNNESTSTRDNGLNVQIKAVDGLHGRDLSVATVVGMAHIQTVQSKF
jgi:hypothetical protein